jgi:endonuclease/exonuclease/phosphatase family metal-dependent hydrolase
VLCALGLVAAGLSLFLHPGISWIPAFFGLAYPFWFFLNLMFILFWLFIRWKYSTVSAVALALTWMAWSNMFAFHFSGNEKNTKQQLKVMSFNVRNFDLYNWKNNEKTLDNMLQLILVQQPDVLCLQEFFNADSGKFQTIRRITAEAGLTFYRFEKTVEREHYGAWGVATFSRYPITGSEGFRFENSKFNAALYTDVKMDSSTLRIFNAHLQSVYFSQGDYEYIEQISRDQDLQVKPTRQILQKVKQGFIKRAPQAEQLAEAIAQSPLPVILCGDFNDTPVSFSYHLLSSSLQDAFVKGGWGYSPTYTGSVFPFRIDFILADKKLSVLHYQTIRQKLSDHYAIACTIGW